MINVLHLVSSGNIGGAERVVLDILGGLDGDNFRSIAAVPTEGPMASALRKTGARVRVVEDWAGIAGLGRFSRTTDYVSALPAIASFLGGAIRTGNWARDEGVNLIHAHGWKAQLYALTLRTVIDVPQIWHVHDFPSRRRFGRVFGLVATASGAHLVAISNAVARELPAGQGIRTIRNGVEAPAVQCSPIRQDSEFIVMVGALAPWKGQDVFLQALSRLTGEFPSLRATIAGDEIYVTEGHRGTRAALEALSHGLGLERTVCFKGWVDDISALLQKASIVVHASKEPEPFGRVLIEAMAAGRAVVAARGGGVSEVVEDGITGLLVPPGDSEALAQALKWLLKNPEARRRMEIAGRERVIREFSLPAQLSRIADTYHRIAGGT